MDQWRRPVPAGPLWLAPRHGSSGLRGSSIVSPDSLSDWNATQLPSLPLSLYWLSAVLVHVSAMLSCMWPVTLRDGCCEKLTVLRTHSYASCFSTDLCTLYAPANLPDL